MPVFVALVKNISFFRVIFGDNSGNLTVWDVEVSLIKKIVNKLFEILF